MKRRWLWWVGGRGRGGDERGTEGDRMRIPYTTGGYGKNGRNNEFSLRYPARRMQNV